MLFLILTAAAQEFSSDRPGYGDSTGIIPTHHSQVEGGISYSPAYKTVELPLLIERYGVLPWLEVRVGIPNLVVGFTPQTLLFSGSGTLSLGAKGAFSPVTNLELSFIPTIALPAATPLGQGLDVSLEGNWDYQVNDRANIAGNLLYYSEPVGTQIQTFSGSVAPGYAITPELGAYGELIFFGGLGQLSSAVGAGVTIMASHTLQFDINLTGRLFGNSLGTTIGAGVSTLR